MARIKSIREGRKPGQDTNSPVLADAAHVLSERLLRQLEGLSVLIESRLDAMESRFLAKLEKRGFGPKERRAIHLITLGAAVRFLFSGTANPLFAFLEQVEYNGRRLAKLNVDPALVLKALSDYDQLLAADLRKSDPRGLGGGLEAVRYRWVREQLHFCVVLTLNNSYFQVREEETRAQSELFRIEIESRDLPALLEGSMGVLKRYCRADAAQVFLFDGVSGQWQPQLRAKGGVASVAGNEARRRALSKAFCDVEPDARRCKLAVLETAWHGRWATVWSVPLIHGKRLAGVMQFAFGKPYEWLPRELDLLHLTAERCLLGAEKVKLMQDLAASENRIRELAMRMMQVEEAERRRISRELHDEAGQSMLTIRLQLEMLEAMIPAEQAEARARAQEVREITENTILEVRRLIAALSPAVLEQLGLAPGIRHLVARFQRIHPAKVGLDLRNLSSVPPKTAAIVYRLVQECINNIAKHSQARTVNISIHSSDGSLQAVVEDDGIGFRTDDTLMGLSEQSSRAGMSSSNLRTDRRESFGLAGLRERVALLGGAIRIESRPRKPGSRQSGSGTRILIELPIPVEATAATA